MDSDQVGIFGILVNGEVKPAMMEEWEAWFEKESNLVARTNMPDGVIVSTIFLGINHGFDSLIPKWFETMVFGGLMDNEEARYTRGSK